MLVVNSSSDNLTSLWINITNPAIRLETQLSCSVSRWELSITSWVCWSCLVDWTFLQEVRQHSWRVCTSFQFVTSVTSWYVFIRLYTSIMSSLSRSGSKAPPVDSFSSITDKLRSWSRHVLHLLCPLEEFLRTLSVVTTHLFVLVHQLDKQFVISLFHLFGMVGFHLLGLVGIRLLVLIACRLPPSRNWLMSFISRRGQIRFVSDPVFDLRFSSSVSHHVSDGHLQTVLFSLSKALDILCPVSVSCTFSYNCLIISATPSLSSTLEGFLWVYQVSCHPVSDHHQ